MNQALDFSTLLYLPASAEFEQVANAARTAGAQLVWEGAPQPGAASLVSPSDVVRVGLLDALPASAERVLLAADHALDHALLSARLAELARRSARVWVEVVDSQTGRISEQGGAQALVACGFEGSGFVGEESNLVLVRRLLRDTALPVFVRGAIGPDSAAAVVAIGATGYVLDRQLWLCDEFPSSEAIRARLQSFNPTDTRCLGTHLGFRYRAFALVATRPVKVLAEREVECVAQKTSAIDFYRELIACESQTSWDLDLRESLWPLGQDAALAAPIVQRFKTTGEAIRGIAAHVAATCSALASDFPLAPGKGIARVNRTRLPIHQGPMAQVSDTPAFARAVAEAGALPWLALGNMPPEVADDIVASTAQALLGLPYGAGIIGLDANPHREAHIAMMKRRHAHSPILGLVAAGTAEQAMQLESAQIPTYLHTPTPGVLRAALREGHTKFLLEGAEAGGHVGTIGSLALWQYAVLEIERAIDEGADPRTLCVVAAGGIGDAASAGAAAVLFFGLCQRGVNFGIQMGTAYLMTREAVSSRALSPTFQSVASRATGTVIMGESVSTPTRVLHNQAADVVLASEKERLLVGVELKERKHLYEKDNLGGLRAAAKAQRIARIDEQTGAIFEALGVEEQEQIGLFHCGQGVALCDKDYSIEELHTEVTDNAKRWICDPVYRAQFRPAQAVAPASKPSTNSKPAHHRDQDDDGAIAIIGVGARMPGAHSAPAFWQNIVNGVYAIGEVPTNRWDASLYYDADPGEPDKTYSKIGGWVTDFTFDRRAFRLPPKVVESMDITQQLTLEAAREALADAGYLDADFDRDRCAVILGNALGGDLRDTTNQRILYPEFGRVLQNVLVEAAAGRLSEREQQALLDMVEARFKQGKLQISEDSMPGELANIVAGRVAQSFDLRGPNFITDAACASSLAALDAAVRGLRARQFDMALCGGADCAMGPTSFVKFSKIGALSPDGSRPFDAGANGFVMGEGAGVFVLKRLADAERDGDSIYALVRGVGGSSDGRGKAITAPNPEGQQIAVRRAFQDAGFGPRTISLLEAHGTSTPVGDPVEVHSLLKVINEDDSTMVVERIALGSIKSMIGHLKAGAGAASIIKVAMALKHAVLPPTLNVETVNPALELDNSPLRIQHQAQAWETIGNAPRRAGVSAFGFGGTNFHAVLEGYDPSRTMSSTKIYGSTSQPAPIEPAPIEPAASSSSSEGIIAFSGADVAEVREKFEAFAHDFEARGPKATSLWQLALHGGELARSEGGARLAIVYADDQELTERVQKARLALETNRSWRVLTNQGIYLGQGVGSKKLAMLFPGQGTQYLGMLSALKSRFPVVAETFKEADQIMAPVLGCALSEIIDPDLGQVDENDAFRALMQTEVTQPAVLTVDVALYRVLLGLGLRPDMVAGHSLGEYGACVAAGVMSFRDALLTVAARGTAMASASPLNGDCGLMAGISASAEVVRAVLEQVDGYVVCANINCPGQTIIAGLSDAVAQAVKLFEAADHQVVMLPVSHAFHTKVVAEASAPLRHHLGTVNIASPRLPILTNVTGDYYPAGPGVEDSIRDLLSEQVAAPVEFIKLIERMYADGVRTFVEVGPKRAQTSFVANILEGREHLAVHTNHPKKGDVASLYDALAQLWAAGAWPQNAHPQPGLEPVPGSNQVFDNKIESLSMAQGRDTILHVMMGVLCEKTGYDADEIEIDFELEADLGIDTVKQAEIMAAVREHFALVRDENFRLAEYPTLSRLADYVEERLGLAGAAVEPALAAVEAVPVEAVPGMDTETIASIDYTPPAAVAAHSTRVSRAHILDMMMGVLCEKTGYDADEIEIDFELEADLGIDTVKQAEIMAAVREHFALVRDEDFRLAEYPTLSRLADYVEERLGLAETLAEPVAKVVPEAVPGMRSDSPVAPTTTLQIAPSALRALNGSSPLPEAPKSGERVAADVVISGCALGLPGLDEVFSTEAVERLLSGTNFISTLPEEMRQRMVDKHIVRLKKHEGGGGEMVAVEHSSEVIKLAGQRGAFALREWGISDDLIDSLDPTSQLAIAAGFEALRDAGLPLVPRYRETTTGKKVTTGWALPREVGDETGVIFASAFAGQDALIEELRANNGEDYKFNHRFLLRVLGMANARFAEFVGARGPNTKINNACASTTTALAMAQDWIRAGRCKRVVILSADDASGADLMEWVGAGFLATGAATTEEDVTRAALPFDKRRHGMIIGMGALALVVEAGGLPEARGVEPIADLLATRFVNSGFHPTRLDVDHIAATVDAMVGEVEARFEIARSTIASRTVFVSHETYTPARGGSASAEIAALRRTFGDQANQVVIANTKGFTGHAMGAGIEDILAMKVLQHERVPPIANFSQPDPELGDLRLSKGGAYEVDYVLRLAAGFGSQLALAMFRHRARTEDRVDVAKHLAWLGQVSGFANPVLELEKRTLRLRDGQPDDQPPTPARREPVPATAPVLPLATSFQFKPVVVEAHTAASFDFFALRARLANKRVVILAGPMLVTDLMQRAAERCGARVLVIGEKSGRGPLDTDLVACDLLDESAITAELSAFGVVDGIINLLGFGNERNLPNDVYLATRRTFHVARAWAKMVGGVPGASHFFVSITGMGGRLGFDQVTTPLPLCGAVCGFTKALAREWEEAAVRVVDIARDGFYPELGLQILAETFHDTPSPEVGLTAGIRYVPVLVSVDDIIGHGAGTSVAPDAQSVVLITGGGRGITAEFGVDLARRFGCKLALVGRSELTHPAPLKVDMELEKERARQQIGARGERVTPVAIRQALAGLEAQRTIAQNMERMSEAGSDVAYFACDVADTAQVEALIEAVRARFGRVDGVIHGAGVEESRLLADKDVPSFDRVFRGKALGGLNLWSAVRAMEPAFFVAFSSIAGRFGNAGQTDYSAANDALSKLVAQINARTSTRALSIDWTAWDEVGMAVEGSMKTILLARGVEFLPASIGAPMVADALARGLTGECLVAGELGELGGTRFFDRSKAPRQPADQHHPVLVDAVVEHIEHRRLVVERTFDPQQDPFINDHIYEGVAILPGVMGYELIVSAASLLVQQGVVREVVDVRFERAVKLHKGEPLRLMATAEVIERTVDETRIAVVVESSREGRTGRALSQQHYRAVVVMGALAKAVQPQVELNVNAPWRRGPNKTEIYKRFFHTGVFQVLDNVPFASDEAVIGHGRLPVARLVSAQRAGDFLTDPMVREMAFQTAGLWGMATLGQSFLPLGIGRSLQRRSAQPGEAVCIRGRRRNDASEGAIAFDIDVLDEGGEVLQVMEKVELIGHRTLLEAERFAPFKAPMAGMLRLSEPEARLLLSDRGLSFDDIVVNEERVAYDRLQNARRRGEWLAARVAAKEVVRRYLRDFCARNVPLACITIAKTEQGAPFVRLDGEFAALGAQLVLPHMSITHSAGIAIAALSFPGRGGRIGVDLEKIERRDASFINEYFSAAELALVLGIQDGRAADQNVLVTALWTLKEATTKALGLGMHLRPDEIDVAAIETTTAGMIATLKLKGRALEAFEAIDASALEAHVEIFATMALATVRFQTPAPWPPVQARRPKLAAGSAKIFVINGRVAPAKAASMLIENDEVSAAVAAFLKHRNLLDEEPVDGHGKQTRRQDLGAWKL
ncbi:MAG: SDR family NAD(P)-dependent oxidoreductase [Bradymonadaceae bacterium]|nr:SDR family NAD(P)-dependent oxidoreductase [Lujinxingiaceae bacterium]